MTLTAFFIVCASAVVAVLAAPPRCDGNPPNQFPINTAPPTFVSSVPHGKLYKAGVGNDSFHVVHLYGTPYQMGYAMGSMFKREIPQMLDEANDFLATMLEKYVPWLPLDVAKIVIEIGGYAALQYTYDTMRPFIADAYQDEMRGIADGADLNVSLIQNFNMIPELTKAACTILGAYGPATAKCSAKGGIVHLRALDFDPKAPMVNFPCVTIYHPTETTSPAVANFGWIAMVGSLTAFSDNSIGIGEKVWGHKEPKFPFLQPGEPWMFILRDVLSLHNMSQVIEKFNTANKTCAIHVGVGVGGSTGNLFLGFELAAPDFVQIFNDTNFPSYPQHPLLSGVVYWEKHEPSKSYCFADLLQGRYGDLSAEFMAHELAPMGTTGDTHLAVFDYKNRVAFFSNARKTFVDAGPLNAYERQITQLDLAALFKEKE